jgi:hypothetical protein
MSDPQALFIKGDNLVTESPAKPRETDKAKLQKRHLLEKGKNLVSQLYATIRTAQIYDRTNSVYTRQAENLLGLIQSLLEGTGEFLLKSKEGYLFLNDTRLRFSFDGYVSSKFIAETFRKLQFECIFFSPPLNREELDEFMFILAHADAEGEDPFDKLQKKVVYSNNEQ